MKPYQREIERERERGRGSIGETVKRGTGTKAEIDS
jgi:hypothetical protein